MPRLKLAPQETIELLIRARYPIIYIESFEEDRIVPVIKKICEIRGKEYFEWACTEGFTSVSEGQKKTDGATRDPIAALDIILKSKLNAVYLLKDFHPFLNDYTVVRKLRDTSNALKTSYKTIIILSPVLRIPSELEKEITVVDFPLPNRVELTDILDGIIKLVHSDSKIKIDLSKEDKESIVKAALGLSQSEAKQAFAKAIVYDAGLTADDVSLILSEKEQIVRKAGYLEYFHTCEEFNEIGGLDLLKEWLKKRGRAFSEEASSFGLPAPKGILLVGVQGCGKSLTAKAVSGLWQVPLLRLDVGKLFSGVVGSSEENARRAIQSAEAVAPCILWIDEIEKGLAGVQSSTFSDAGTTSRVFGTLITWMQEKTAPVFLIATANDIMQLPPELMRKGRFDDIFFVDLPDVEERKDIFSIHIKRRKREPSTFNLDLHAEITVGFSGAEIEQAIISAMFDAFDGATELKDKHIEKAVKETVPLSRTMKENIEQQRLWARTRARFASSRSNTEELKPIEVEMGGLEI
jgi:SpoVK/Ycf46/Vps4 family AAA+-type ATPase